MNRAKKILSLVLAFACILGISTGVAYATRDIGNFGWTNGVSLGAGGSGSDTFTGSVYRVKYYSTRDAVVNCETEGNHPGYIHKASDGSASSVWFTVLPAYNTNLIATDWLYLYDDTRANVEYLRYDEDDHYYLFIDNDQSYSVVTAGTWCPDASS